jgi:signal transduction histidine kinase
MILTVEQSHGESTRRDLVMLLLASIACSVVLTLGLTDASISVAAGHLPRPRQLLIMALIAGVVALAVSYVWHLTHTTRQAVRTAEEEAALLRRNLLTTEAIIKAEPQVLVFWEHGQGLKVVTHTLTTVPGLPENQPDLLRFGTWLEPKSAEDLKQGLDRLFAEGRPLNLLIKTTAGGHLEADGRAAGARAVLRLRDVAGYKRDLVKVLEQHQQLARDIRSSRALLNALPMPVWLRGADGRIEWINAAYVKAVEATDEAQVRDRQIELLEKRQRTTIERVLSTDGKAVRRMPVIVAGERKSHEVIVLPLEDAVVGAAIDVTALESAQGALDRQIAASDRTLDRVQTGVAIFNRDQKLTFFNEAYQRLWQLDTAWLVTHPGSDEILDRLRSASRLPAVVDYRGWRNKLLAVAKSDKEFEDWWHLPDGRMIHVVIEQSPDGGVTYLFDDATERFALEQRFNAMIDVQRETLDSLKEGVAVFGTDGRLKLFNTALMGIWKLARPMLEEAPHIDQIITAAKALHDDSNTWIRISRSVTALPEERDVLDGQMLRADHSVVDYTVTPLPDGATLVTFIDVTDAKRYERALVERNDALVASDRLKTQFISHVSYELRTPLTNIIGFSELLGTRRIGSMNDKQREYLGDINASSRTLLSIIDDILDLASIDAGGLELKHGPVKIRDVIDAAILGVHERAGRARLTLDIAIADDVDSTNSFTGDEDRVRQVLYNLLSNAVGFSKMGDTVRISSWRERDQVLFMVADQGVGIPKDQQERVFKRFESQARGSKHRGTGLGLSIVKSLVELHGGTIELQSEPGHGTSVTVAFPSTQPLAAIAVEPPAVTGPEITSAKPSSRRDVKSVRGGSRVA